MPFKSTHIVALIVVLCADGARADDSSKPLFSYSGFGTLGAVHSSENQADYTDIVWKPNGAGHSYAWSADVDTRLGLQVTLNPTENLSAVVQAIAEQDYDNTFRPYIEWANVKYQFTPDLSIRVGRIAMPTFLVGEYRKVGYAVPWVRPPVDFYGLFPVTNNDGVDASYHLRFGDVSNTLQGIYGRDERKSPDGTRAVAKNIRGAFDTVEFGAATFRGSYQEAELTLYGVHPFFELFRQFGLQGNAIADKYDLYKKTISILSFGASYDPGKWFVMGEWVRGKFNSFLGTQTAWYGSGGYRFGEFTPYFIYSESSQLGNTSDPGLDLSALPPFLVSFAAGLNAGLNGFLLPTTGSTVSLGSRWDLMKNIDLKVQFDHMDLDPNSHGALHNLQSGFRPGGTFNVFSITLDFVF